MTMHFRALAEQAMADGAISCEEILALRRESWSVGRIDADEADAIVVLNGQLRHATTEWVDFFAEAISEFILGNSSPRGYLGQAQAEWLLTRIDRECGVESMAELELLAKLFEKSEVVPEQLKAYALAQIEQAVLTGCGPTRDGGSLDPGCISEAECRLLRRFIFAAGGDRTASVSKAEAEMLFRLKDAALGKPNAAEWEQLFVQGAGNYLKGFSGHEQLSSARAAELEGFMNDTAVSIGGFFSRMADTDVADGASGLLHHQLGEPDLGARVAESEDVTADEKMWLQARLDADGQLDEMEKALLDFLAEA